jgi:diguanylate cyclase (GGDEF)-like protein
MNRMFPKRGFLASHPRRPVSVLADSALRERLAMMEGVVAASLLGLEAAARRLEHMATHDPVTGLPNRALFEDRVAQAIKHANRTGAGFALAVLDLDRFKVINQSLGHRAGDELLNAIARRLEGSLRESDTVARLGGDGFAVIIAQVHTPSDAMRVAHKMMLALQPPIRIDESDIHPSASIGIACFPSDGVNCDALLAHADAARLAAKQPGRQSVRCFEPDMNTRAQDRVRLEGDLHQALKLQQLELHYQPKVDAVSGHFRGAEALLRWRHPARGLVSPGEFIPLAEECGLIIPIGAWVIRQACRQIKAWQNAGVPSMRVAVNVSAAQFKHHNLVETVRRALAETGVSARHLEIELTESAVMSNPEESVTTLQVLSRMGVAVSMDDFGTGYSCMSYLRRFPLDKLKIDRSFVHDLVTSPEAAAVVRGIISLAHSLHLKVIAEGVETLEQMQLLKSFGCDQYQGFHFSPPISAAAYEQLMRGARPEALTSGGHDEIAETCSRLALVASA